jgi:putative ABC transport system permease protein
MYFVALRMLFGDRTKYLAILLGVTLASLVITQQGAIFTGLMSRTFALISDMGDPDIWVMDPKVQFIDDTKPLAATELFRVRGIEGVAWAAPLFKGTTRARMSDGTFQNCVLLGLDDATLTGSPPGMVAGRFEDLRQADAIVVDLFGATRRFARPNPTPGGPPIPLQIGDSIELNDRRGVVVGISRNTRGFQSQPTIYTTYSRATAYAPRERKVLSFVLVKAAPGQDLNELCARISRVTGLAAYTRDQFKWKTVSYFLENTGIPINFGIAITLGFVIGVLITGFMFYSFTVDNLRFFGTLKAMGASDNRLLSMVILQALIVACLGFGLGVGAASLFGTLARGNSPLAFRLPWQLVFVAGSAVFLISIISAMVSMRRVLALEPAVVFKGA